MLSTIADHSCPTDNLMQVPPRPPLRMERTRRSMVAEAELFRSQSSGSRANHMSIRQRKCDE